MVKSHVTRNMKHVTKIAAVSLVVILIMPSFASAALLQANNLDHIGSFKAPYIPWPTDAFDYGGTAISYNPARNSLFMVGHAWKQLLAEISIPELGGRSIILQPLVDSLEGKMGLINEPGANVQIGGTFPWGDKLIVSAFVYYDGNGTTILSHFIRPIDMSVTGQVQGPFRVGPLGGGFYGGSMASIPANWQGSFGGPVMTGLCCVAISGRTSLGPSAHSFDPNNISETGAKALVYYPLTNPTLGDGDPTTQYYSSSDAAKYMVMPEGSDSVLFFGRHGTGEYCYGPGTNDPALHMQPSGDGNVWCYDPTSSAKGPHNYPYYNYVWAYDANELAKVVRGEKQPWDVLPYATWNLNGLSGLYPVGAAYDSSTQRIYLSMYFGDGEYPLIEVLQINSLTPTPPPPPPPPTPQPIVGDINLDHIVNSIDYSILNSDWFTSNSRSDLNRDQIVNAIDYSLLNANWLRTW